WREGPKMPCNSPGPHPRWRRKLKIETWSEGCLAGSPPAASSDHVLLFYFRREYWRAVPKCCSVWARQMVGWDGYAKAGHAHGRMSPKGVASPWSYASPK